MGVNSQLELIVNGVISKGGLRGGGGGGEGERKGPVVLASTVMCSEWLKLFFSLFYKQPAAALF